MVGGDQVNDRLRRLDAMFAERVLGWAECDPTYITGRWELTDPPDNAVVIGRGKEPGKTWFTIIPPYTRSLDAAWEGAKDRTVHLETYHSGGPVWRCYLDCDCDGGYSDTAEAPYPAEALVMACLRACGVSEDNLI